MKVENKKTGNVLEVTPEQWETLKQLQGRDWRIVENATIAELTRSKARADVKLPVEVQNIIKGGKPAPLVNEQQDEQQITKKPRKKKQE